MSSVSSVSVDARLDAIEARLDRLSRSMEVLVDAEEKRAEFINEFWPIACEAGITAVHQLDKAERDGWLDTGRSAARILQRLLGGTSQHELDELADSIIAIKDAVKALTQPEVLAIVEEAGEVLQGADHLAPVTPTGLFKATGDVDVQRGLAVVLELLRHAGRATREVSHRKTERARGVSAAPAPVRRVAVTPVAAPAAPPRLHVPMVDAVKSGPSLPGPNILAVAPNAAFTGEGFLVDHSLWTEALASAIAADSGFGPLSERHLEILRVARRLFAESNAAPNIRRLSSSGGVAVKELYQLFPQAPGKMVARLAGISKPVGCV